MDLINETEIKDECLEYIDNDGSGTQSLDQVLRYNELQEKNYIDVKREIEVKNEPLDIVKANDDPLNIEEDDSINGEFVEPSSELNENQVRNKEYYRLEYLNCLIPILFSQFPSNECILIVAVIH
ncbi:hypothetical protein Anas_13761 [Armadillidium nasatum]|uniref:Uncharacterized protein n=1 Tax=Armadillidium nasatum TaxID=96803 RepID=A0A5N5T9G3_9CRUS|nr:hypothetical protein Anas_13761 [Armadillidium nasatum]